MSEDRLLQDYLNDILESIDDINEFVVGLNFEAFANDKKTVKAVIRSMEVIGEAVNNSLRTSETNTPSHHGKKWLV